LRQWREFLATFGRDAARHFSSTVSSWSPSWAGIAPINLDGHELLLFFQQNESSGARVFPRIGNRLLVNIVPLAINVDRGAFSARSEGCRDLLVERRRATHPEAPVVHGPTFAGQLENHVLNGVVVHTVTLDEANLRRYHPSNPCDSLRIRTFQRQC